MKNSDQLRKIVDYIKSDNKIIVEEFYVALLEAIHKGHQANYTHKLDKQEISFLEESIKQEEVSYQESHSLYKEKLLEPVILKQLTTNFNRISVSEQWILFALMSKALITDYSKNGDIKEAGKEQLNRIILLAFQITYEKTFNAISKTESKETKKEALSPQLNPAEKSQENIALSLANSNQKAKLELKLTLEESNKLLELIIIGSSVSEFLKNFTEKEQVKYKEFIDNIFDIKNPLDFYKKITLIIQEIFFKKSNSLNRFDHLFLKHFYPSLKYIDNLSENEYKELCEHNENDIISSEHCEIKVKIITLQLLKDLYPHRKSYLKVITEALKQCHNLEDYLKFSHDQINHIIQKKSNSYSKEDKIALHYCYQIINFIKADSDNYLQKTNLKNISIIEKLSENNSEILISGKNVPIEKSTQTVNSLKLIYNKKLINLLKSRVEHDIKKTKKQIAISQKSKAIILLELNNKKKELLTILLEAENSKDLTSLDWCKKYIDKLEEILNFIESKNKHKKSTLDTVSISLLSSGQPLYRYKNKFLNQMVLINDFYNGKNGSKLNPYRLDNIQHSPVLPSENDFQVYEFINYLRLVEIRQMAVFRLNKYMYERSQSRKYMTFDLQNDNPSDQISKQARFATAITSINLLLNDYDYKKQTIDTFLFKLSEQINDIPHTHSRLKRELRTIVYEIGEDLNHNKDSKDITITNSKKIINQFVFNPSLIENLTTSVDLESYHRERFSFSWKNDVFSPSFSLFRKALHYVKDTFQIEAYMKETKDQYQTLCVLKQFLENDYGFYHDRGEVAEFYTIYMELCSVALSQVSDPELKKNINTNMDMIFEHFIKQKNNGIIFSPEQPYRINIGILRNANPESLQKISNAQPLKEGQNYRFQIHKERIITLQNENDQQSATQIFENFLTTLLVEHFDAEKVLNSGKIGRALTPTNMLNMGVKSIGNMTNSQLPGSGLVLNTIAAASDKNELAKAKEVSQNVSSLASTNVEIDELCKRIAKELTFMYEDQIKKLDSREVMPFARCTADRIMEEAAKIKRKPNESPDHNRLINAVRKSSKRHRWMGLKKASLLSSSRNNDYIAAEDLFSKPAVMTIDEHGMLKFYIHHDAKENDVQRYGLIVMETSPTNMREISKEQLNTYGARIGQYDEFITQVLKRVLPQKAIIEESHLLHEENEVSAMKDKKLVELSEQCSQLTNENERLKSQITEAEIKHEELAVSLAEFNNFQHQPKQEKELAKENIKLKAELVSRDEIIADQGRKIDALIHILTTTKVINSDDFKTLLSPRDPDESDVKEASPC